MNNEFCIAGVNCRAGYATGDINILYCMMYFLLWFAFSCYLFLTVDDFLKAKVTFLLTPNISMSKQLNY